MVNIQFNKSLKIKYIILYYKEIIITKSNV